MITLKIIPTQNDAIVKFEFPDFITQNQNYEFKNIDDAKASPLAMQLFYLPFVKTVYISGNFIAVERYNIVQWADVQEAVAEQIQDYINAGGVIIINDTVVKKQPTTVYGESTPNPATLKFVINKMITKTAVEFKAIAQTEASPLAEALFGFGYVTNIFIDENYISVTKNDTVTWDEVTLEIRTFIKQFIENGGTILNESLIPQSDEIEVTQNANFDNLDEMSQKIINILEEFVKPAVAADGGNIVFEHYDPNTKQVKVLMQGACNGCPSSTFTLKNGIENMLREMLSEPEIVVVN